MTREETKTVLATMAAVYNTRLMVEVTELTLNIWSKLLEDLPYKQVTKGLANWLKNEKYPPTIADLRKEAEWIPRQEAFLQAEKRTELEMKRYLELGSGKDEMESNEQI